MKYKQTVYVGIFFTPDHGALHQINSSSQIVGKYKSSFMLYGFLKCEDLLNLIGFSLKINCYKLKNAVANISAAT